ncbi:hypothetical protein HJC23_006625 [Cyclotella cryptica]|uniref:Uncharacterized protein n=1 Tax=Cyclotella cryptica TaxID=29204 RepID=A0ABD3QX68_9STRA|eukprot:CCRYP_001044-RA/>CCRYP_001044-RA protein AED:0.07 eAED:0.07 QI:95/1/1/1/0/0/2/762/544
MLRWKRIGRKNPSGRDWMPESTDVKPLSCFSLSCQRKNRSRLVFAPFPVGPRLLPSITNPQLQSVTLRSHSLPFYLPLCALPSHSNNGMAQEPLSRTTSLSSLRENGLFTGEEVTIKIVGEEQILAVLAETEEECCDEGERDIPSSSSAAAAATEGNLISNEASAGDEILDAPPKTNAHEFTRTMPQHEIDVNGAEERGDEGVNAILIENHPPPASSLEASSLEVASSDEQELNIHHCIATSSSATADAATTPKDSASTSTHAPLQSSSSPIPPPKAVVVGGKRISQLKRSITRKMNRAAFRMKAAVSRNPPADARTEGTNSTVGSGAEENDCHSHEGGTRGESLALVGGLALAMAEEELVSMQEHSFGVTNSIHKDINDTVQSATNEEEETDFIEYDIVHTTTTTTPQQPIPLSQSDPSTEQIDPTYAGPYDDNKSLVTYSTGDFDMSQMYSRSWSTIAQSVAPSKLVVRRCVSNRSWSGNGPIGEETVLDFSLPSNVGGGRVEYPWDAEKEEEEAEEECVSLDGLSLVHSIVGDDRSYVEDY